MRCNSLLGLRDGTSWFIDDATCWEPPSQVEWNRCTLAVSNHVIAAGKTERERERRLI